MDDLSTHKLRRAWFSGYRVADVEILVAQMSLRLSQLAGDLGMTRARLEEAERERRELAALLDSAHRREVELIERASAAEAERDEAVREALSRATHTIDEAQLDAARIRADATLDAERARGQVDELLRLRDTLVQTMRGVISDFDYAVGRVEKGESVLPAEPTAAPVEAAANGNGNGHANGHGNGNGNGNGAAHVALPRGPEDEQRFEGRVELDAGPFGDFAALSSFERSLSRLGGVEDVYVRRFSGDRALIELTLAHPLALVAEMRDQMPYGLELEAIEPGRLAVTVAVAAGIS
jgi:hypothetical protein